MALLDDLPFEGTDPQEVAELVAPLLETVEHSMDEDNPLRDRLQRMRNGETPAQIMGLTADDLDVLYGMGIRQIQAGELDKAKATFQHLGQIDPLEARHRYCLGLVLQLQGALQPAAHMFLQFLALDATNPDGYMRLGELHLAADELDMAGEFFRQAIRFSGDAPNHAETRAQAEAQLSRLAAELTSEGV
ncbi:hypothetical protein ACG74X_16345 [Marivita sp. S0852]|uniref:hypothetical protein n=1 Tax=Marivita sp. S0852 TaxID=3373893 RepID=UPI003982134B